MTMVSLCGSRLWRSRSETTRPYAGLLEKTTALARRCLLSSRSRVRILPGALVRGLWRPLSLLSAHGVPVEAIALLAGHNQTATTELVYRHQIVPALTHSAEVMDQIFSQQI